MQLSEVVRQGDVAELVHHQPDRDGQRPLVHLIRLIVEGLKRAGVEHTHKIVKGAVIVGDDGKDGLFAVPHQAQLHIVLRGDADDLRQDECGQPDGGGQKDGFCGFAGGLLENFVLPHSDVRRVLLLQRLKEQVQGRLKIKPEIFFKKIKLD